MKTIFDTSFHKDWEKIYVTHKEAFSTSVTDFHKHDFYEINLIVSGNVEILLPNISEKTSEIKIVLTRPDTPHFITCKPDILYSRYYLLFSKEFLIDFIRELKIVERVFGESGNIITLTKEQAEFCKKHILKIKQETNTFRQQLLVLYLLSYLSELSGYIKSKYTKAPSYIIEALSFIESQYSNKITAASLAEKLYIGRTTLMTNFKKYTGSTLNDYIISVRLKKAIILLKEDYSEHQIAEMCGFSDACSFIRCFKKHFNTTPHKFNKTN